MKRKDIWPIIHPGLKIMGVLVALLQQGCVFESRSVPAPPGERQLPPQDARPGKDISTHTDGDTPETDLAQDFNTMTDSALPDLLAPDLLAPDLWRPDLSPILDYDGDGFPDSSDNCPYKANADQKDTDQDKVGDVCDNCQAKSNPTQADADNDGRGDVCDNCKMAPNANQADDDGDGIGDACDNCVSVPNADQLDSDFDEVGNVCDNCIGVPNGKQEDGDGDTVGNVCDNCLYDANKGQEDLDSDDQGDVCDLDMDGDTLPNTIDPRPAVKDTVYYYAAPGTASSDFQGVGLGNWKPTSSSLCQTDIQEVLGFTWLKAGLISQGDFQAETRISGIVASPTHESLVGLGFRAQIDVNQDPVAISSYLCYVNLKTHELVLSAVSNYVPTVYTTSGPFSVPGSGPFRVRLRAKGDLLICEELVSQQTISHHDSTLTDGTIGFITSYAKACFEYLFVVAS